MTVAPEHIIESIAGVKCAAWSRTYDRIDQTHGLKAVCALGFRAWSGSAFKPEQARRPAVRLTWSACIVPEHIIESIAGVKCAAWSRTFDRIDQTHGLKAVCALGFKAWSGSAFKPEQARRPAVRLTWSACKVPEHIIESIAGVKCAAWSRTFDRIDHARRVKAVGAFGFLIASSG